MKNAIVGILVFFAGVAVGAGINDVLAQDQQQMDRWEISHAPTGLSGMGKPGYYVLRFNRETGEVWVAEDGKDFKLIKEK